MLAGGAIGWVAVAAVFLSDLPEGLSSAAGAKEEGKTATYTFTLWTVIAIVAGLSSFAGYTVFADASPEVLACVQGVAAGAILAMIMDTMAPEAAVLHTWGSAMTHHPARHTQIGEVTAPSPKSLLERRSPRRFRTAQPAPHAASRTSPKHKSP